MQHVFKCDILRNMHRGFKYRIYPDKEQQEFLLRQFGCCRYVWNAALAERQKTKANIPAGWLSDLRVAEGTEWLSDVAAVPLYQVLRDLDSAYKGFFRKTSRYPRYKSKRKGKQSARFEPVSGYKIRDGNLILIKAGAVDVAWHRPLPSGEGVKVGAVTVSLDAAGRYWVSFKVEMPDPEKKSKDRPSVGVDLGITHLAVLSTGERLENPKNEKRLRKRLARKQRVLAKKQKGSKNREKARKEVGKVYAKITDRRKDWLHKVSTRLVNENQVIVLEDLNVNGMLKNHSLARAISDVSWSTFRVMLEYKAQAAGTEIVYVDRFYPSSKLCSACNYLMPALPLSMREWQCPECGVLHDRDLNAATNILAAGLAVTVCGEDVRPKVGNGSRRSSVKQKAVK